jgi:hypothetical protein
MSSLRPSPAAHQRQPWPPGPLRTSIPCGLLPRACPRTLLPPLHQPHGAAAPAASLAAPRRAPLTRGLSATAGVAAPSSRGATPPAPAAARLCPLPCSLPCSPRSGLVLGADGLKIRWGFGVSGGPACSPGRGPVGFYPAAVAAPSLLQLCRPLSGPPSPGPGSRAAAPGRIRHSWPGPRHPFPAASASVCSNHSAAAGVALAPA